MLNLSSYNGNQYVGVFSCANENISLIPVDSTETLVNDLETGLQVKCIKTNIASTNLIGALVAMNSYGAIVASMASSFLDRPLDAGTVVFGEVGLTGEVRGISQMDMRIKEAARMGFKRCIIPQTPFRNDSLEKKVEFIKVSNLKKLLEYLF